MKLLLLLLLISRLYFPTTVDKLSRGLETHTHVTIVGTVVIHKQEQDSDWHLRIQNKTSSFITAECISSIPDVYKECAAIKVNERVQISGISRFDGEHKWWEIHPVESIQVIK